MITIYKLTNKITNDCYIGQTKNKLNKRFAGHINDSKRSNSRISNAIKKYGKDNFEIKEIIKGDFNKYLSDYLETHFMQIHGSLLMYNIKEGGNNVKMKDETKTKISNINKGRKNSKPINYKDADRYNNDKLLIVKSNRSKANKGGNNAKAKKVLNIDTGKIYECAKYAAIDSNINPFYFRRLIRSNKINFKYI